MHNTLQFQYKVWDDVTQPIGIVQIVSVGAGDDKQYEYLAHFLNKNNYIVVKSIDNSNNFNFGEHIRKKYNRPIFLIGDNAAKQTLHPLIQQTDLFSGAISVVNTKQYKPQNVLGGIFTKRTDFISKHIPLMIISIGEMRWRKWGHLGKLLFDAYGMYDASNLSVMMYPNINTNKIFNDDYTVKCDILDFLTEIQNQK